MSAVNVRTVEPGEIRDLIPALADILVDCVEGGASVNFMLPYSADDARIFWNKVAAAVDQNMISLLVAEVDGVVAGTVQVAYDTPPNQPHRAEIRKLLVHRRARRHGLGAALMQAAEAETRARGRSLLVLDTASDSAERLYTRLGWTRVGTIPDYALLPGGGFCDTILFYKRVA